MSNNEEFHRAVDDHFYRKRFIASVPLGEVRGYISGIEYRGRLRSLFVDTGMRTLPPRTIDLVLGKFAGKIVIYPPAFSSDLHKNYADFYNSLIHHEGTHARDSFILNSNGNKDVGQTGLGLEEFPRDYYWLALEIRALNNQIENLNEENSDEFVERLNKVSKLFQEKKEQVLSGVPKAL